MKSAIKKYEGLKSPSSIERKHLLSLAKYSITRDDFEFETGFLCFAAFPKWRKGYSIVALKDHPKFDIDDIDDPSIFACYVGSRARDGSVDITDNRVVFFRVDWGVVAKYIESKKPDEDRRPEGVASGSPNCGVVACAGVLNKPYPLVEDRFRNLCGRDGRWGGRTYASERRLVIESFGYKYRPLNLPRRKVETICSLLDKDTRYIVTVGGHAYFFADGLLTDQNGSYKPEHPSVRRRIAVHVVEVYASPTST